MQTLWGDFLPVPPEQLRVPQNGDDIEIDGLRFYAVDTPGHADHHFVYLLGEMCFSGDIGGVRLAGIHHLRLPMPPPDFHLGKWRLSLKRLSNLPIQRIAPTHFGISEDVGWHLKALGKALDEVGAWIDSTMPFNLPDEDLNAQFITWIQRRSLEEGVSPELIERYEAAIPSWMSPHGIQRYWRKFRSGTPETA
jgi:glyoxylase-like metal-dependent hydrolase (beta-lactamase superfamily II)